MIVKFSYISILVFIICCSFNVSPAHATITVNETDLVLVQIVFRHGDRTPTNVYPNDPYGSFIWEKYGGLGKLSQKGMQQHYAYGNFLKNRYQNFLTKTYNPSRVSIKSTTFDRTMMSVQSLLASLYEPVDFQIWNPNLLWQPIPVLTANLDALFLYKCPRYNQLLGQVIKSDEFIQANNEYKDVIDIANKYSGMPDNSIITLSGIADTSFCEKNFNLSLPRWVQENYNRLLDTQDIDFFFGYRTIEMARLFSGGVLNEMKKNINSKVISNTSLELALFSSHDTYVMAFIKLLELSERIYQPPYVSSVTIELRKSKTSSDYFVLAYVKNNTADQPIKMNLVSISGCDLLCPLDKFMAIIQNRIVDNPDVDCKEQSEFTITKKINLLMNLTFMMSVGFALVASLLVISLSIQTYRRIFWKKTGYMRQEL